MDSRLREVLEGHLPDRVCIMKLAAVMAGVEDPAPESEPAPDPSQEGDDSPSGVGESSEGEGQD